MVRIVIICLCTLCSLMPNFTWAEEQAVYTYEVKGVVRQLPAKEGGEIYIKHDPIPDYVNQSGKKVGMHAMTMPFWLADGVSTEGLAVGDPVEFTLESRWKPKASDKIVGIKKSEHKIVASSEDEHHHH